MVPSYLDKNMSSRMALGSINLKALEMNCADIKENENMKSTMKSTLKKQMSKRFTENKFFQESVIEDDKENIRLSEGF